MIAAPAAGPWLRVTVAALGVAALLVGLGYAWQVAAALRSLVVGQAGIWSGPLSLIYLLLWLLFSLSAAWTGAALLLSARRGARRDIVPGPPLYVAGASLVGIGLFLLIAGALAGGSAAVVVGVMLMVAEYRSDTL